MNLIDISKASRKVEALNGLNSVSENKVYWGHPLGISKELLKVSVATVCCINHGAMLCMTKWEDGYVWRCPTCNEGCIEIGN